jgi:GAF domain-containing protein
LTDQSKEFNFDISGELDQLSSSFGELNILLERFFNNTSSAGIFPSDRLFDAKAKIQRDLELTKREGQKATVRLEQLQALARTSALITSSLDLDEVLESVMDTIVELTGAERAYLMLQQETGRPSIRAARNWDKETIGQGDAQFSGSIVNAAIQQGTAIITDNAQTDDRFGGMESIMAQQVRSILCIPLTLHGRLVGVLYADNRFHMGVFKEEMLPILTAFGNQAAIAIDNARAFGTVKEGLAEAKREIRILRIAIDDTKSQRDVNKIVASDAFQELRARAQAIRSRRLDRGSNSTDEK